MSKFRKNNPGSDGEQPVLTPEEIEHIKLRRKKAQSRPGDIYSDNVYFSDYKSFSEEGSKKTFRVNIPEKELYKTNSDESFYSNPYREQRNNDISISRSKPRERYDHEAYMAAEKAAQAPEPRKKPEKKKKRGCLSMLISLLLVVLIISGCCYGYVYSLASKVQHIDLKENGTSELLRKDEVKNILLLGLDKEDGGISRSDTMMLLSIDTESQTLKLTSFLRDMWVSIPGYNSAKLNASYAYGGAQLTVDTLESNFNIDIDHFVLVDFEMFIRIIDSLGGVTVDITDYEAEFLRNNTRVKVPSGTNTLSGEYALIYSRIRKLDSDFYRTQRQRKVISAIIDKAKKTNPVVLATILSKIMPLIQTDIAPAEMTQLAFSALKYIRYDIGQLQVPADNAYYSQTISGQAALVPDMEANKNNIHKFIYSTGD